jgi:hypothetical protein
MYQNLIDTLKLEFARHLNIRDYAALEEMAIVALDTIGLLLREEDIEFKDLQVYTFGQTLSSPSVNILLLDELTDRLIVNLAKVNGLQITKIYTGDIITQVYMGLVRACLMVVERFLSQRKVEFKELQNAR